MFFFFVIRVFIFTLGHFLKRLPLHHIPNFQRSAFHSNFFIFFCAAACLKCDATLSIRILFLFVFSVAGTYLLFSSFCFHLSFVLFLLWWNCSCVLYLLVHSFNNSYTIYPSCAFFCHVFFFFLPLLIVYICYTRCHSMFSFFLLHFMFFFVVVVVVCRIIVCVAIMTKLWSPYIFMEQPWTFVF